jgi:ribosome biogenesis protein UTP30
VSLVLAQHVGSYVDTWIYRQPIPVNLLKKDLKSELEAAISSTYLHQNAGTCTSIKVAHTGMSIPKILANVEKSIPGAVSKLHSIQKKRKRNQEKEAPKKGQASEEERIKEREESWENIQSLGLKTHSSVCLPIWSCSLADRWNIPTVASTSNRIAGTNGASKSTSSMAKNGLSGEEEDDTMSEGDEEERKLAEIMEKSTLSVPKSKSEKLRSDKTKVGDGEKGMEAKKKKRKAEEVVDESVPVKKSKLSDSSTLEKTKPLEKVTSEKSKPAEKAGKKDKGSISSSTKTKITDGTLAVKAKTSDAVPSILKTKSSDTQAAEGNKRLERPKAADFMDVDDSRNPPVGKKEKEKKKKDRASSGTRDAPSTKTVTSTTTPSSSKAVTPLTSTSSTTPPLSSAGSPLKSALKKTDSNLTASELKEKKVKRASFSVVEKKKEKLTKGIISSGGKGGTGKSGVSGKSKKALVGRGPRM